MKKAIRLLAVAAALFVGTAGAANALWGAPKGAGTMVPAQTNPAAEITLTVTFDDNGNGGTHEYDNPMQNAVDEEWMRQEAALGGDKAAVTTLALTGNATAITMYNWYYVLQMFNIDSLGWTGLKALDLSGMGKVTEISNETVGSPYAPRLNSIKLPPKLETIGEAAFFGCNKLTAIEIPASVKGEIGDYAFYRCNSLTGIELPAGVTSIGASAFANCYNLTSVKIPAGVTSIGASAFDSCTNLTSVKIPAGVTSIGAQAFVACFSLTDVTIPAGVTSIGDGAFDSCTNLTGVTLAVSGDYTLSDIGKIGSVTIPDGKEITKVVVKSGGTLDARVSIPVTLEAGGTVVNNSGGPLTVTLPDGTTKSLAEGESLTGTAPPPPVSSEPEASQPEVSSAPVSSRPEPVGDPGPLDENGMRLAGRAEQFAVLSGNGAVWNGSGSLELRIGAPLARFRELQWNGTVLRQGKDFTLREGSTVIALLPAWLETLPAGTHYLSAIFEGGRAELEITVAASLGGVTSDGAGTPPTANPETGVGESAAAAVLVLAALLCGGALLAVLTRKKRSR